MAVLKNYDSNESEWEPLIVGKEGTGIPSGGSTGQILSKTSGSDYATAWTNGISKGTSAAPLNPQGAYFDGTSGLVLSGLANNWAQIPDSAALSITGDMEIIASFTHQQSSTSTIPLFIKETGNITEYQATLNTGPSDGFRFFRRTSDGVNITYQSSVLPNFSANVRYWVKIEFDLDNGAGQSVVKFYTSTDGITYTQLGTDRTSANTTPTLDAGGLMRIGFVLSTNYFTGTLHSLTIKNGIGGTTALDANFSTVPANSLAFTESSANAATVSLTTTRYYNGIPNHQWSSISTYTLSGNTIYYHPFAITEAITIDMVRFDVVTATASNRNMRYGIYAANRNNQPVGAPLFDSGDVLIPANTSGFFIRNISPITLQPGNYVTAMLPSATTATRGWRGGFVGLYISGVEIDSAISGIASVTYGAMPNPPVLWTNRFASSGAGVHPVLFRWYPAT